MSDQKLAFSLNKQAEQQKKAIIEMDRELVSFLVKTKILYGHRAMPAFRIRGDE